MAASALDTDVHPVFATYSAGNFAEVAPERLSPMSWSLVGVPVERGMRRLVGRVLADPVWATGSHFVFVGYFSCAPFHNLSAFCHLARQIPGVEPELVTHCYFQGAPVPAAPHSRRSWWDGAATAGRMLREATRARRGLRGLIERVEVLEAGVDALSPPDSLFGLCQLLPSARMLVDDVWEAHYAATMGLLPLLSLQDGLGRAVTTYWDELEPWVNRPTDLVWDRFADDTDAPEPGPGAGFGRAGGFTVRAFYEVADDHEPWTRYTARAGGPGSGAAAGAAHGGVPADPWDMVPLARLAQLPRLTWLVRSALQQREATKSLAMRVLHALRPVLAGVGAARGLPPGAWPYLTVGELADAALTLDALCTRARWREEDCAAALARPAPRDGAAEPTRARPGARAARGLGVCPGQVEGTVVRLAGGPDRSGSEPERPDGLPRVLVCERADVDIHHLLSTVDAVVTARGSALSHVAILLREYGIPSVVGHPLAAVLRDGQRVRVDGTTGEVTISEP